MGFFTLACAIALGLIIAQNIVLIFLGLLGILIVAIIFFALASASSMPAMDIIGGISAFMTFYIPFRWLYYLSSDYKLDTYKYCLSPDYDPFKPEKKTLFKSIKYAFHWEDIKTLFNYSK